MKRSNSKLMRNGLSLVTLVAFAGLAGTAQAQIVHANSVDVQGNFCAGSASCTGIPADDIVISDTSPSMSFDDTQAANGDYQLLANSDDFRIRWLPDVGNSYNIFSIENGAIANSMYIDSAGSIGIGETDPTASLHITKAGAPGLMLEGETTGSQVAIFNAFEGAFAIQTDPDGANNATLPSTLPLVILNGAPSNSLWVDGAGRIGMGTSSPGQPMHLLRDDGTAQILVEDTDASATAKTLFRIKSNFNAKFEIENTDGATWAFTNAGTDFRVSRQGSGVVEFQVFNNGNATLAGTLTQNSDRNAKQAIIPVDPQVVLDKVVSLPISQWQYKDDAGVNHVGPMAQDFHAAFALGDTDTGISTIDTAGVALAAIQALEARNQALAQRVAELETDKLALEARLDEELSTLRGMLVDLQMSQTERSLLTATR